MLFILFMILWWHFSVSNPNRNWDIGTVSLWLCCMEVVKEFDSLSTVTFVLNVFVMCVMDMGWFWIRSYVVLITSLLRLYYVFVDIYASLATYFFLTYHDY